MHQRLLSQARASLLTMTEICFCSAQRVVAARPLDCPAADWRTPRTARVSRQSVYCRTATTTACTSSSRNATSYGRGRGQRRRRRRRPGRSRAPNTPQKQYRTAAPTRLFKRRTCSRHFTIRSRHVRCKRWVRTCFIQFLLAQHVSDASHAKSDCIADACLQVSSVNGGRLSEIVELLT
ncbi:uncharacterized protein J3D65DRAFT_312772 [Phyllosticta citribraziliensis]|uniref:Secreted protein n=1 Tax=Phyllosticta citribraziliensis TaxID=989973 RepID=A0ABR1LSB6_9PEZI